MRKRRIRRFELDDDVFGQRIHQREERKLALAGQKPSVHGLVP